ncbi:MAG: ATP-binding protein [Oscillochloris sp.]|nr:ATP-binding protein [Oscillochloris sp.]
MLGNVSMDTVAQLTPTLFRKLRDTGQVDLAMAAARTAILHQPDWWMPALFLRVRSGQLFTQPYIPEPNLPGPFRGAVIRMVEDYEAIFGGRDHELAMLDSWLDQATRPYAFFHAPTGCGKTALLIHWVARVQQRGGWTVVFVPVSLRYQTATAESVLGALATALAAFHGEREQLTTYNTSPDQLRPLIADYLRRPPDDDRRLLVVLDGLDEAVGWHIGRELFPREPGPHLHIVASARQQAHITRADWYEQLGWQAGQTTDLEIAGLRREAVSDILRRIANPLDSLATNVDLLSEIARISAGHPLTIRYLVEGLKDGTLTPGNLVGLTEGLEAYVRFWLDELEQHSNQADAIHVLLSLCAVALGPLTSNDIRRLATKEFRRRDRLNQAAKQVGRFIIGDGSEDSGYIFSHPRLREIFI